jgi:WD40 repeat protein
MLNKSLIKSIFKNFDYENLIKLCKIKNKILKNIFINFMGDFDYFDFKIIKEFFYPHVFELCNIYTFPNEYGKFISIGFDGNFKIWDINKTDPIITFRLASIYVKIWCAEFLQIRSEKNLMIAFGMRDMIILWDIKENKKISDIELTKFYHDLPKSSTITQIVHLDKYNLETETNDVIAISIREKEILLIHILTGVVIKNINGSFNNWYVPLFYLKDFDIRKMVFADFNQLQIIGLYDNAIQKFPIVNKKEICAIIYLKNYTSPYTHEKDVLVTSSYDLTIDVWSINENQHLKSFKDHKKLIGNIVYIDHPFINDTFISVSKDETLKIWKVELNECEASFKIGRDFHSVEVIKRNRYMFDIVIGGVKGFVCALKRK